MGEIRRCHIAATGGLSAIKALKCSIRMRWLTLTFVALRLDLLTAAHLRLSSFFAHDQNSVSCLAAYTEKAIEHNVNW
jgi:hypothetical protein